MTELLFGAGIYTAPAIWDGDCFYPLRDNSFSLPKYLGNWHYLAGTEAPFSTQGCQCNVQVNHSLIENGKLFINGSCNVGSEEEKIIRFEAVPSTGVYGLEGAYRIDHPAEPKSPCPGPNYIVTDLTAHVAIVQSSNYSSLHLISTKPHMPGFIIKAWMRRAEILGLKKGKLKRLDHRACTEKSSGD
ncbi:hypothetical protein CP533_1514 [Ophiocordyceps camponoti-saundersi (nom. inval.)]|nr:hypothetical protein CP533_1514 [Ophiocordyceps camponoti-saundersi (nom. inval.)]